MTYHLPNPKTHSDSVAEQDAAIDALAATAKRVKAARTPTSRNELQEAVDVARAAGVGWTRIGDTLGIASGNAYQRYRKRRESSERCDAGSSDG